MNIPGCNELVGAVHLGSSGGKCGAWWLASNIKCGELLLEWCCQGSCCELLQLLYMVPDCSLFCLVFLPDVDTLPNVVLVNIVYCLSEEGPAGMSCTYLLSQEFWKLLPDLPDICCHALKLHTLDDCHHLVCPCNVRVHVPPCDFLLLP